MKWQLAGVVVAGLMLAAITTAAPAFASGATAGPAFVSGFGGPPIWAGAADGRLASDQLRERCLDGIERRLDRLDRAADRAGVAGNLTDAHQATLSDQLTTVSESLTDLQENVNQDTGDALRSDCQSVIENHRVYVLVLPRTRLVIVGDTELAAAQRLTEMADKLGDAIGQAEDAGEDVSAERADLDAMRDYITSAQDGASGIADAVLGLTPADWNENHTVLDPSRKAAMDAWLDLRSALRLAREVRQDLRS